mmetsp:Transcript_21012/g.29661  ORF Transcript_21012/g.29661 Transcript_21012/m.29661 type:complete len:302 (-) Transcript_21012:678-1583(-)
MFENFIGIVLLISTTTLLCSGFVPLPAGRAHQFVTKQTTSSSKLFVKGRFQFEFEEDFYFTLNVTRDAERSEIRKNYRLLARDWHPDVFVDELRFTPEALSVKQLQAYLDQERVGVYGAIDKQELVDKTVETFKRTGNVPEELELKRQEIQDRFALLNEAYNTLYDEKRRRMYDLSGDWGIPGGGRTTTDGGIGDREEAARVRARQEAAQRDPLQEKVYRQYMKEKEEKEKEEAERIRKREEKKAREREERNKERAKLGLKPEEEMTEAEIRAANQEKIKAMWGNVFTSMTGGVFKKDDSE